jgi:hypothetical protein
VTARASRTRRFVGATLGAAALIAPLAFMQPAAAVHAVGTACRSFPDIEQLAQTQATRRENTLDALSAALHSRQDPFELNGTQVGALQQAKGGITALVQTVQSGCYATKAAFASAVRPLFTQYRVYWLRAPQTDVIQAADYLGEARSRLGDAAAKLGPHVKGNTKAMIDLNEMNVALASADVSLGTPPSPSPSIKAVAALVPAVDMTANVTAIDAARSDLLAARTALITARNDAQQAIADLESG